MSVTIRITPTQPFTATFNSNDPTGIFDTRNIYQIITQLDPKASVTKLITARYNNDPYSTTEELAVHVFAYLTYKDGFDEDSLYTLQENDTRIVDFTKDNNGARSSPYVIRKHTDTVNPLTGTWRSLTTYIGKEGQSMADVVTAEYLANGKFPEDSDDDIERIPFPTLEYFRDAYSAILYI
jgi:hypothetical protein